MHRKLGNTTQLISVLAISKYALIMIDSLNSEQLIMCADNTANSKGDMPTEVECAWSTPSYRPTLNSNSATSVSNLATHNRKEACTMEVICKFLVSRHYLMFRWAWPICFQMPWKDVVTEFCSNYCHQVPSAYCSTNGGRLRSVLTAVNWIVNKPCLHIGC